MESALQRFYGFCHSDITSGKTARRRPLRLSQFGVEHSHLNKGRGPVTVPQLTTIIQTGFGNLYEEPGARNT